jgi:hypothetical protein
MLFSGWEKTVKKLPRSVFIRFSAEKQPLNFITGAAIKTKLNTLGKKY